MLNLREFHEIRSYRSSEELEIDTDGLHLSYDEVFASAVIYYFDEVELYPNLKEDLKLDMKRLIEARIFGKDEELYIRKLGEGRVLKRLIKDSEKEEGAHFEAFDELHKIVERREKDCGHKYLRVRNYFSKEGELELEDWRFVAFEDKGGSHA